MRRRLRKWLGIATLWAKCMLLQKEIERLRQQVEELKGALSDIKNQPTPAAKAKSEKQERRQMTNWSEFLREIGQGEEIRA